MKYRYSPVFAVLFVAGTATAATYWIPASAHVAGVGGTQWRTDLGLHNPGTAAIAVSVELLESGKSNPTPAMTTVTVGAGMSLRASDALDALFGFTGAGALRLTAEPASGEELDVTSRTFNESTNGTYGQFIPGIVDGDAIGEGSEGWLVQLSRSADGSTGFRTNVGFVNVTSMEIAIAVDLYDASGTLLGTVDVTLAASEHRQITDVFSRVTSGDVADGYAIVTTTTSGGRFLAYASVVDNRTGDPIYVPAL